MRNVVSISDFVTDQAGAAKPEAVCSFCGKDLDSGDAFLTSVGAYVPCGCAQAVERSLMIGKQNLHRAEKESTEEKLQREVSLRIKASGLQQRFLRCTLENYRPGENRNALAACMKFVAMFPHTKGITLWGNPGTGKTHLACAVAKLVIERGFSAVYGAVPALLSNIKAGFSGGERSEEVMRRYKKVDLLVFDDFGKEKPTDWVEETVYEIINSRYEAELPTVVTTNIGLDKLAERYAWNGDAIKSRLTEMNSGFIVKGNDVRLGGIQVVR